MNEAHTLKQAQGSNVLVNLGYCWAFINFQYNFSVPFFYEENPIEIRIVKQVWSKIDLK